MKYYSFDSKENCIKIYIQFEQQQAKNKIVSSLHSHISITLQIQKYALAEIKYINKLKDIMIFNLVKYIKFNYKMQKQSLYLITGNAKKLEQFKQILGDQFDFKNQNVDLPELQGDPEEVAREKVLIAYKSTNKAVLVEDTSLGFNAYKGLPGPYIKWFLKSVGPEGLAKMVQPFDDKTGFAMCIIAYMSPELRQPKLFIGKTLGKIVEPRGSRDFGWDPVFEPDGYDKTYAELPKQIKNTISHRFRAIQQMKKYFAQIKSQMKDEEKQKKQQVQPEKKQQKQKPQKAEKEQKPQKAQKPAKTEKKEHKSQKKQEKEKKEQKHDQKSEKRQTRSTNKASTQKSQKKSNKKDQKKSGSKGK